VKNLDEIYQEFLADIEEYKDMNEDIAKLQTKLYDKQSGMIQENEGKIQKRTGREAYRIESLDGAL